MITIGTDNDKVVMKISTETDAGFTVYIGHTLAQELAHQLEDAAFFVSGETEEFANETAEDARQLIADTREGAFDNASVEFLKRLWQELEVWIDDISAEVLKKDSKNG